MDNTLRHPGPAIFRRMPVKISLRNLSLVFGAGCWGALWNSLAVWLFGFLGVAGILGVKIAPALTAPWLYPRLVWGGIWGLLFLVPLGKPVMAGPGSHIQPGPYFSAVVHRLSVTSQKRLFGVGVGLSHPRPGGVLQCRLGGGGGPVAAGGAAGVKGPGPAWVWHRVYPRRSFFPKPSNSFGAWGKIF